VEELDMHFNEFQETRVMWMIWMWTTIQKVVIQMKKLGKERKTWKSTLKLKVSCYSPSLSDRGWQVIGQSAQKNSDDESIPDDESESEGMNSNRSDSGEDLDPEDLDPEDGEVDDWDDDDDGYASLWSDPVIEPTTYVMNNAVQYGSMAADLTQWLGANYYICHE
jgi:hypothetical protein